MPLFVCTKRSIRKMTLAETDAVVGSNTDAQPTVQAEDVVAVKPSLVPSDLDVTAWHRLELSFLASGTDAMLLGRPDMSAAWKLFLFGNGSPTHHLGLLSGSLTEVDVIGHEHIGNAADGAQDHIHAIPAPRCRRQVWLRNARGERLGYATSWLHEDDVGKVFKNQRIPIGKNILENRTELFRDMKSVFYGTSPELEAAFGFAGPFWGRSYLFWKGGRPVTFIYEVFSPALEKYMGPVLVTNHQQ